MTGRIEKTIFISYLNKGELDRAVADFDESIRLESWNPNAFLGRAKAREEQGQYWTVVADLFQYLDKTEDAAGDDYRQKVAARYEYMRANPPEIAAKSDTSDAFTVWPVSCPDGAPLLQPCGSGPR